MSVKHIGLVLDHFEASAPLKLVAIILADHADSDGVCWPSYRRIAERANMHERSVQRHIKELQERGIVTRLRTGAVIKEGNKRIRVSNAYRVNAHVLMKLSTTTLWRSDTDVYLENDTSVASRVTPVSTKPSKNRKSNHQPLEPVDNSRDPLKLGAIFDQLMDAS